MRRVATSLVMLGLWLTASVPGCAWEKNKVRIAVASNFAATLEEIATRFAAETGQEVQLVFGSSGKHFAQIVNGAPFAAFFSADARRPRLLEERGAAVPGTRFTYALGTLVLWSPDVARVEGRESVLASEGFRFLAIANPKLAPYGEAARQVLEHLGAWERLQPKLVRGENIAQTYQYVASGNAELGFVALSQVREPGSNGEGSRWVVPQDLHDPIEQQAVLLVDDAVARSFLAFVKRDETRARIRAHGYRLP